MDLTKKFFEWKPSPLDETYYEVSNALDKASRCPSPELDEDYISCLSCDYAPCPKLNAYFEVLSALKTATRRRELEHHTWL